MSKKRTVSEEEQLLQRDNTAVCGKRSPSTGRVRQLQLGSRLLHRFIRLLCELNQPLQKKYNEANSQPTSQTGWLNLWSVEVETQPVSAGVTWETMICVTEGVKLTTPLGKHDNRLPQRNAATDLCICDFFFDFFFINSGSSHILICIFFPPPGFLSLHQHQIVL